MLNEKKLARAKEVEELVGSYLEEDGFKVRKDTDNNGQTVFRFGAIGDDLPMEFVLLIDAERELVRLLSMLPFACPAEKALECSIATSYINYRIADGSFDYNILEGRVYYRMTSSFLDSLISKDLIGYMINCSCFTVDRYNDKLYSLLQGNTSLQDFINND